MWEMWCIRRNTVHNVIMPVSYPVIIHVFPIPTSPCMWTWKLNAQFLKFWDYTWRVQFYLYNYSGFVSPFSGHLGSRDNPMHIISQPRKGGFFREMWSLARFVVIAFLITSLFSSALVTQMKTGSESGVEYGLRQWLRYHSLSVLASA